MARTVRLVVTIPPYAVLSVVATLAGLSMFVFSLNVPLVSFAVTGSELDLGSRISILVGLYPFVGTGFGLLKGLLLLLVSSLVGVDIALVAYHVREHGLALQQGGSGAAGLVFGTLGAGCAACGSALLVGVLSLVGASGTVLLLPLDGLEFALLAAVVLLLSIYWVADGMRGGTINGCPVD